MRAGGTAVQRDRGEEPVVVARIAVGEGIGGADQKARLHTAVEIGLLEVVELAERQDLEAPEVGQPEVGRPVVSDPVAQVDAEVVTQLAKPAEVHGPQIEADVTVEGELAGTHEPLVLDDVDLPARDAPAEHERVGDEVPALTPRKGKRKGTL